jgi:hypothetical protein
VVVGVARVVDRGVAEGIAEGVQRAVIGCWCLGTRGCVLDGGRRGDLEIAGQGAAEG